MLAVARAEDAPERYTPPAQGWLPGVPLLSLVTGARLAQRKPPRRAPRERPISRQVELPGVAWWPVARPWLEAVVTFLARMRGHSTRAAAVRQKLTPELRSEWRDRLYASGFNDIERGRDGDLPIETPHGVTLVFGLVERADRDGESDPVSLPNMDALARSADVLEDARSFDEVATAALGWPEVWEGLPPQDGLRPGIHAWWVLVLDGWRPAAAARVLGLNHRLVGVWQETVTGRIRERLRREPT